MAERIEKNDIISQEALDAIKELTDNLVKSNEALKSLLSTTQKANKELSTAKGTKEFSEASKKAADTTNKLSEEQVKNAKISNDLAKAKEKLLYVQSAEYKELEKIKKETREYQTEVRKGIENTNTWTKALGSFAFKFNALGNIASNVFSTLVNGAKQFVVEGIKMAAVAEGVKNAFNGIADANYLDGLRKATRGAVSDLSLMKAAVQANNFKIPLEQLTVFLKFAGDRALSTGEDFDFLVESIVKGLGRKSVLILDNLGLSVAEINNEVAKTGDFMKGAANVIEREMAKAGEVIDTNATKISQLRVAYQNLQTDLGGWLLKSSGVLKSYQRAQDIAEADISGIRKFWIAWVRYSDEPIKKYKAEIAATKAEQYELFAQIAAFKEANKDPETKKEKEIQTIETLTIAIENLNAEKKVTDISDTKRLTFINKEIERLQALIDTVNELGKKRKETALTEIISPDIEDFNTEDLNDFINKVFDGAIESASEIASDGVQDFIDKSLDEWKRAYKEEVDLLRQKEDEKNALITASSDFGNSLVNSLGERNRVAMEKELLAAEGNEKKKEEIKRKYLKRDQNFALMSATINTAETITKIWAKNAYSLPVAIALSAIAAATLGTEISTIKAQKFAKGTQNSPEGFAWVGEQGTELMVAPDGSVGFSPSKASLTYLEKGTKIFTADQTKELMNGSGLNIDQKLSKDQNLGLIVELKKNNELMNQLVNKPVTSVNIDSNGIGYITNSKTTLTRRIDKYFRT